MYAQSIKVYRCSPKEKNVEKEILDQCNPPMLSLVQFLHLSKSNETNIFQSYEISRSPDVNSLDILNFFNDT